MKVLFLTDHATHSVANSLYTLANAAYDHDIVDEVAIISRSYVQNEIFFDADFSQHPLGWRMSGPINYEMFRSLHGDDLEAMRVAEYDMIVLRIPRPISDDFLISLQQYSSAVIVNNPLGIIKTSSKEYLLSFKNFTPPLRLCQSEADILEELDRYDIVLKPLREYGGKGILRIKDGRASSSDIDTTIEEWLQLYRADPQVYLSMKYLKNVKEGDKRIVVSGGRILGVSLRLPAEGQWLCNVAQGGTGVQSAPTAREHEIVAHIAPILRQEGIVLFGLDTLVDDDGQRVISEINTLSIGGIAPLEEMTDQPLSTTIFNDFLDYYYLHS